VSVRLGKFFAVFACVAGSLAAQTTLYVTVGPYFYSYNATTGAPIAAPLGNTNSYTYQAAIDSAAGELYVALWGQQNIGIYDLATGATVNQALVTNGYNSPTGLALWNGSLYVASSNVQVISRIDPTTGTVTSNFITGLASPSYMVIDSSGRLYVSEYSGVVSVWNASTGTAISRNFISGLTTVPSGLALDNAGRLYVSLGNAGKVAVYDAASGALLNSNLISGVSGFSSPRALAVDGAGDLFVSFYNSNAGYYQVGSFNALTGAVINSSLLINGGNITSLNLLAVPEPATWVCLAVGLVWLGCGGWRQRRSVT
jgi:DNA-binding beta-propeller fold protein YncE